MCGHRSRDPQEVRAKRDTKDHAETLAKTHKEGRFSAQGFATGLRYRNISPRTRLKLFLLQGGECCDVFILNFMQKRNRE